MLGGQPIRKRGMPEPRRLQGFLLEASFEECLNVAGWQAQAQDFQEDEEEEHVTRSREQGQHIEVDKG